jgi:hypothetical protein
LSIVLEGSDSSELGSIACPGTSLNPQAAPYKPDAAPDHSDALAGYYVPDDVRAKYSGKHKRFTIRWADLAGGGRHVSQHLEVFVPCP